MKKRLLSDLENSLFESVIILKLCYFFPIRNIHFTERRNAENCLKVALVLLNRRFVSDTENSIFQDAKTLEVPSMSFWCHEKAKSFGFGKSLLQSVMTLKILFRLLWGNEKPISFGFGIFAFSGRQNTTNRVKFFWRSEKANFFRIRKIRFFRAPKRYKLRQGYLALRKIHFFPIRKKCLGTM